MSLTRFAENMKDIVLHKKVQFAPDGYVSEMAEQEDGSWSVEVENGHGKFWLNFGTYEEASEYIDEKLGFSSEEQEKKYDKWNSLLRAMRSLIEGRASEEQIELVKEYKREQLEGNNEPSNYSLADNPKLKQLKEQL